MNLRTLAVLAALIVWWGIGENVAHAQTWRLGTYGLPHSRRTASGPYVDPSLMLNSQQPGMVIVQPDGSYAAGLRGPGTASDQAQTAMQTGHPVTHLNYQKYFPLNYGTSDGTNINAIGITGNAGIVGIGGTGSISGYGGTGGFGMGTVGIQPGSNPLNIQRGRTGAIR